THAAEGMLRIAAAEGVSERAMNSLSEVGLEVVPSPPTLPSGGLIAPRRCYGQMGACETQEAETMMTYRHPFWILTGVLALTASAMRPVHAALPSGWTDADIGSPGAAGSATVDSNGVWTIMGSGGDIEGTSDQFNFAYQKVTGDATVTAHFLSMVPGDGTWTKVGPMIR